jgi:hypothetical protein
VVGAFALAAHEIPRATRALDFWVRTGTANGERVLEALRRFGPPLDELSVDDVSQPDIVVQIGREPARVDIMTSIDGVRFEEAWGARLVVALDGLDVPILTWGRPVPDPARLGEALFL